MIAEHPDVVTGLEAILESGGYRMIFNFKGVSVINVNNTPFSIENRQNLILGKLISYSLSIVTSVTLCLAMFAVPISGANAPNGGISYPYLETIKQFPRDYIWQYSAILMVVLYVLQFSYISSSVINEKKAFAKVGLIFSIIVSSVLLMNYYLHVSIVPISLMSNETHGIPLLTQYNPHGVFIALEELGFSLMLISFLALIFVFDVKNKTCSAIRIIYGIAIVVSVLFFIYLTIRYGLDRKDRYEVIVISMTWLALIINSILIGNIFSTTIKKTA